MFDVTTLLQTGGLLVLFLIIFAESGMMVGFLFPGDTLLFSAGILAATGKLSLATVLVVIAAAAILGNGRHSRQRQGGDAGQDDIPHGSLHRNLLSLERTVVPSRCSARGVARVARVP